MNERDRVALRLTQGLSGLALVALLVQMIRLRFVCDDAYISFRYVRNLLEGHGLVFNPGEWIEGYTNFLWVIEVAALWAVGIDPALASLMLSWTMTGAVVWVTARWARQHGDAWVVALAMLLLATERSLAVWASGGLATRQFTLFVTVAWWLGSQPGRRAAAGASAMWGLAALTRPEAYLLAPLSMGLSFIDRWRKGTLDRLTIVAWGLPAAALVTLHLAFRRWAYGEWLPNTYYAKSTGGWAELGFQYLWGVTLESGLYLIVPLAVGGVVARVRASGRFAEAAGLICIVAYLPFLIRTGGDHFEWRPLDWWWPALAVGAAQGLARVADALKQRAWALPLALGVLVYSRAFQVGHELARVDRLFDPVPKPIWVTKRRAPFLRFIPGVAQSVSTYNRVMKHLIEHGAAIRQRHHASYANKRLLHYTPVLMARGPALPPEFAIAQPSVGIVPFSLPDFRVVDTRGLTDAVIARNPVEQQKFLAHDRRPPQGYLRSVGAVLYVRPPVSSVRESLAQKALAMSFSDDVVLPLGLSLRDPTPLFDALDPKTFSFRHAVAAPTQRNRLQVDGKRYRGVEILGRFDRTLEDWRAEGTFAERSPIHLEVEGQAPVNGGLGRSVFNSFDAVKGDDATGRVWSPETKVPPDAFLSFFVGGGQGPGVGVRVRVNGVVLADVQGRRSEQLNYHYVDLRSQGGGTMQIEIYDDAEGDWGHILADHFVVLQGESSFPK
ncbi:MAG: hypothetical protein AAGA48_16010 [Myxococcota bacterium]